MRLVLGSGRPQQTPLGVGSRPHMSSEPVGARARRPGRERGVGGHVAPRGNGGLHWRKRGETPVGAEVEAELVTVAGPSEAEPVELAQLSPEVISPPVECDLGARVRLAQHLKIVKQQVALRNAAAVRLRDDIHSLKVETENFIQGAVRTLGEASSVQERANSSEEALRTAHLEMALKIEEYQKLDVARSTHEREWQDDLESMTRQQAALAQEVADLERDAGRWGRAAAEQAQRLSSAESKLKNLDAQRTEHRSQGEKLQQQTAEFHCVADDSRVVVLELRNQLEFVIWTSETQKYCWQAVVVGLFLLCTWLWWVGPAITK